MCELLVEKGAMLDVKNEEGVTALMIAVVNGNKRISKYIISKGGNVNI